MFAFFSWLLPFSTTPELPESTEFGTGGTSERVTSSDNLVFLNRIRLTCLWISFLLSLSLTVPLSIFVVRFLSDPYWIQAFAEEHYTISWSAATTAAHFMAEGVLRLALWRTGKKSGGMLILHHLGFFFMVLLAIGSRHVGVFKLAYTLLAMWAWEWPLYAIYATARLLEGMLGNCGAPNTQDRVYQTYCAFFRRVAPIGMAIYVATRILEVVIIVLLATCGCRDGLFWLALSVSLVLVVLQVNAGLELLRFCQRRLLAMVKRRRQKEHRDQLIGESTTEALDVSSRS